MEDDNKGLSLKEFMDKWEYAYARVATLPKETKYQLISMLLGGVAKETLSFALENYKESLDESITALTGTEFEYMAQVYKGRDEERVLMLDLIVGEDY